MHGRVPSILVTVQHHPVLRQMTLVAAEQGLLPVYLVGGFVRDALLEHPRTLDIDLVSTDPLSLSAALHERFGGTVVCLTERVRRVVFSQEEDRVQVDISPLRGGDIVEDLRRRDFTINALAVSLGEEPTRLFDPTGGLRDLRKRQIRVGNPQVLTEDPLRLLRSVRLAAQLEFRIDETTAHAIRHQAFRLTQVAPERLREEFFEILDCSGGGRWLAVMDQLDLLEALLPETRAMRGCLQGPPHRYDVFTHSIETVRSLDRILLALPKLLPTEAAFLIGPLQAEVEGGISRQALLRFAALLHDVGKPDTRSVEDGQIRFLGHAERGAGIVHEISTRIRLGSRASAMTTALVQEHLRPLFLRQATTLTPRARYRFWRDLGVLTPELLLLSLADVRATWGTEGRDFQSHLRFVREMFSFHRERMGASEQTGKRESVMDGHELMARMNLSPGPFVGFLLERLREEVSLGSLSTKEEALRYLKRHLDTLREAFARGESP
ncbi:MAG: HD domain-containing protein [candidate division NC10 bacterium]